MHSYQIKTLLDSVTERCGGFEYYGSSHTEEHSACFKPQGISATFSIHTQDGALKDTYNIQIEGLPPGDYVHTCEASLTDLMELISKFEQSEEKWP